MALKFSITERPDGKAFIFKDLTDWTDMTPITTGDITKMTLEIEFPDGSEKEYELGTSYVDEEEIGVEDLSGDIPILPDGVYEFKLLIETGLSTPNDEAESEIILFGFAAIVSQKVMRASLGFKPEDTKKKREWVLELQRLLNNLRYSAYTGNYNFFQDNIKQLQKIL